MANRDLQKGTALAEVDLEGKRPLGSVSPEYLNFFLGRSLKRDLKENESISFHDVA